MARSENRWLAAYSRKSRHLDPDIPEAELFAKHRVMMAKKAAEAHLPLSPERIFMEVGTSESVTERPVFSAILDEIDALPLKAGGDLVIPDIDRITRGDFLEQAQIYARLQRAGIVLHQVVGGECDLDNSAHEMTLHLKGLVSRWLIQDYKQKVKDAKAVMRDQGEPRNGAAPYGYWNDKSEKFVRDRLKADHRTHDAAGRTPFEILVRLCQEIHEASVVQLARRYHLSVGTVRCALTTPTICGYPATLSYMDPERKKKSSRQRLLKPDERIWPKQPGNYPAACTRDEWWEIQAVLESRRCGKVKMGEGQGICLAVLRFREVEAHVTLATFHYRNGRFPCYRVHSQPCREVARELIDQAAADWLREMTREDDGRFFAWMIADYYQQRHEEPLPKTEELARLDGQIQRWSRELQKVCVWAREAGTETEARNWRTQAATLAGLIETTEAQKEEVARRRSPIAHVDRLVPQLVHLAGRWEPDLWWHYWPELWAALTPVMQRAFVEAFIGAIWVRYEQRCRGGKAERVIEAIEPTPFVAEAKERYHRMSSCSGIVAQSVGEFWREIEALCAA